MIRYAYSLNDLYAAIDAASPDWRTRATARTTIYQSLGRYTEETVDLATGRKQALKPFWRDIKSVYMTRQFHKCVYCEKRLEGKRFASVEWDLSIFAPKVGFVHGNRNAVSSRQQYMIFHWVTLQQRGIIFSPIIRSIMRRPAKRATLSSKAITFRWKQIAFSHTSCQMIMMQKFRSYLTLLTIAARLPNRSSDSSARTPCRASPKHRIAPAFAVVV